MATIKNSHSILKCLSALTFTSTLIICLIKKIIFLTLVVKIDVKIKGDKHLRIESTE
jgi:hypothetical protein